MDQDGYDHDVEVVSAGKYYKKNGQHIVSYKEQFAHEENEVVFFLLSFSDLSHHRTCGSAYGGS